MISENALKDLNIKGENILKNNDSSIFNHCTSDIPMDGMNNFLINSNLDNIDIIK